LKSDFELYKRVYPDDCKVRIGLGGSEMLVLTSIMLEKHFEITESVMPVGYPNDDMEIFLVDDSGKQVEIGQSGEIVVRSRYLSPGYWRRPDITELRFKDDPTGDGVRLYYTGDLGRMRGDGCLFHLGRKDFQVKIRGFRVEIEEIEAEISLHPGIQEAAVVTVDREGQEKRMVAYYVPAKDHPAPSVEEIRIFLKKKLPDYMIPFAFIAMEAMPLTPSGKMDRLSLPKLEEVFNLEKDYVAPRNEVEAKLVQIWEELLEVSPIGIKNDFFMIGGHSLLAATLITRLETEFGKRIDFGILSKNPTIEQLGEVLSRDEGAGSRASLVPIRASGSHPAIYFVHGIGGHVIPFLQLANHLGADQPVYGLQAKEVDGGKDDVFTIEEIAASYLSEIQEIQPRGPYYLGGFSFGGFVAYEMARQLAMQGNQVALLAILDTKACSIPGYRQALSPFGILRYQTRALWEKISYLFTNTRSQTNHTILDEKPDEQEAILGDVIEEEIPEHLMLIMRSNRAALRKYIPQGYHGEISLFKSGSHGRGVCYGWSELTDGGVETFEVPGTHRGIMQEPSVAILAKQIAACIEKTLVNKSEGANDGHSSDAYV
jgi:thioesterase domain-containing protein/acyl carrier protein